MAYRKLFRPGYDSLDLNQSGQPPQDPNKLRLPPAIRQAGVVLSGDDQSTPPPPPPAPPTTRRPGSQGVSTAPAIFGASTQEQIGTFGGIPLILDSGTPLTLGNNPRIPPTVAPPTPSPNTQALANMPPVRASLQAGGQGRAPAPPPQFNTAPSGRVDRALPPQQPVPGRPSGGVLDRVFDWVGKQASRAERAISDLPRAAIKYGGAMPNQEPRELIQYPAAQPSVPMSQPAQAPAMPVTQRPGQPAMSAPARPAAAPGQPVEPPMQRYAFNQMPAATTAPQAGGSPIAPPQLLPSQTSPAAQMSLSEAPGIDAMGVSQGQQAMERYATARLDNQMRKLQPGQRMSSIDLAREQYLSEGARPTLDVKQLGAVMDQARATAYNPNLHATPGRGVSAPMHQALSAMARQGQYNQIVQNADTPIVAKQRRGFGEILKTAGVGALQGLAAGGFGGAIGGALTGGIAQAVSPEAGRRLRFESLERPELERARQQQIAETQQEQQGRLTEAQIGNLESQARERASEGEFRQREQERRDKYVTLGAGEALYERDPQTGRLVPRALNPRQYAERGEGREEAAAQGKMMQDAYEVAQNIEKLRANVIRFGNDIVDQAKGSPEYKAAMQQYQAEVALARQRFPGVLNFDPVGDQYGNTQYNLTVVDPSRRADILSSDEKKAAAPKSSSGATPKRPSSSIEPRPKSKLMSLLD